MMRSVGGESIAAREELDAYDASEETTDVSPEGDAACAGLRESAEELQQEPIDQHHPGR